MKKAQKKYIILMAASALVLLVLCGVLWSISAEAQRSVKDHGFPIYIDEVLAANNRYPNADGVCCDYIELYNGGDAAIKLSGYQLTDGNKRQRYVIPSGTVLEPGAYYVIYCDPERTEQGYASFTISKEGEEKISFLTKKGAVIQTVETVASESNTALYFDRDGAVSTGVPSPGCEIGKFVSNAAYAKTSVCINEFMTSNHSWPDASGTLGDWIELYNSSSAAVNISGWSLSQKLETGGFVFPQGTSIGAKSYLVVYCGEGDGYLNFNLSRYGGESIFLLTNSGAIADVVDTEEMQADQSMALQSDGSWEITVRCTPGNENGSAGGEESGSGACQLVITEAAGKNNAMLINNMGTFSDWVEIHNVGAAAVNLEGWYLSDDINKPEKWQLPAGVLMPDAYTVVFCDGMNTVSDGEIHAAFSLSSEGETLILTNPAKTASSIFTFGVCNGATSWSLTAGEENPVETLPSPGYPNTDEGREAWGAATAPSGPLAIWEYMASNTVALPQAFGKYYDFVEIKNISDAPVMLSDYSISTQADGTSAFVLPEQELGPGEMLVVLLTGNPNTSAHGMSCAPFTLKASGDTLYLLGSDGAVIDYAAVHAENSTESFGRRDGYGIFVSMNPTPGEENEEKTAGGETQ